MNLTFARDVGLPRFIARRLYSDWWQRRHLEPLPLRLPTGLDLLCPKGSLAARDAFVTNADLDWGSEALFFAHLDREGDFLDIGANIGYYSVYGAPVVRRVFSFEPDPRNYPALEANARQATNIFLQKCALSDREGFVTLDVSHETSISRVVENGDPAGGRQIAQVPAETLDGFAARESTLHVTGMKLDTEGHELTILSCAQETIRRDQPLIVTELMRQPGEGIETFRNLARFAAALDFQLFAYVLLTPGFLRPSQFGLCHLADEATFERHGTKMIFLVPRRLQATFVREVSSKS